MGIKHSFVSAKSDGPDATLVRASNWDDAHVIDNGTITAAMLASGIIGAPLGLTGAVQPARFVGGTTSGAPSTGTFAVGDFVIDQSAKIFICTSAGSPGVWGGVSGASSAPDGLPASPSAFDDEFTALAGWTGLGTPDQRNVTDFPSLLHLKQAATSAFTLYGIHKTAPSMPFTVTAKMSGLLYSTGAYGAHGLLVAEASPGKLATFTIVDHTGYGGFNDVTWRTFTNPTTNASNVDSNQSVNLRSGYNPCPVYMRMIVASSTSVTCQLSVDGLVWWTVHSAMNPGFTIANVGIAMTGSGGTISIQSMWDWIRFS